MRIQAFLALSIIGAAAIAGCGHTNKLTKYNINGKTAIYRTYTTASAGSYAYVESPTKNNTVVDILTAIGSGTISTIFCAVLPAAMPAIINTTLFNLEHATRSSAVLGIVGAGGIGIELLVSLRTFRYDEAASILILVFLLVMGVEQGCAWVRRRFL